MDRLGYTQAPEGLLSIYLNVLTAVGGRSGASKGSVERKAVALGPFLGTSPWRADFSGPAPTERIPTGDARAAPG